jgi:hypothetical protein
MTAANGKSNGAATKPKAAAAHTEEGWEDLAEEIDDYWSKCRLTTVLTDPPRHELLLPSGQLLRLRTPQFFEVDKFTIVFVDAVGSFPPLPRKNPAGFLREKFRLWLEERATKDVATEASDRGTLLSDIRLALASCPQTDDARDLDRGSLFPREDGTAWVSARVLLERVRRACPVRFSPADFYAGLLDLGFLNLDVQREEGWRGRVWSVPRDLCPEKPTVTKVARVELPKVGLLAEAKPPTP